MFGIGHLDKSQRISRILEMRIKIPWDILECDIFSKLSVCFFLSGRAVLTSLQLFCLVAAAWF